MKISSYEYDGGPAFPGSRNRCWRDGCDSYEVIPILLHQDVVIKAEDGTETTTCYLELCEKHAQELLSGERSEKSEGHICKGG